MIGFWQNYAAAYLWVVGIAMLLGFGIPLLVAPMTWARVFRWEVPPPNQLGIFLGRSLGVFICVIAVYAIRITSLPSAWPFFFEFLVWVLAAMLVLHIYGAIKKAQPSTETVEIGLWVVLLLATLAFYPVA